MINWELYKFNDLSNQSLYQLLKLRVDVFVVEQNCPYSDLDSYDLEEGVYHLLGFQGEELVAYSRLLRPGLKFNGSCFGRVVVKKEKRGTGISDELILNSIEFCHSLWPKTNIEIQAQEYLLNFYQKFEFVTTSNVYLEDNIPHVDMQLKS